MKALRPAVVVIGDVVYDLLVKMHEPLARGADARAKIHARTGGAGANQAVSLAHLGVETYFVCRVGPDLFGKHLVEELKAEGVVPYPAEDQSLPTGKIVVLVDTDGERTMITDRGANLGLAPGDLPRGLFRPSVHLHLSGYSFFEARPREAALEALRRAHETGMTFSVDPASASLLKKVGPDNFLRWTRGANLCFPNLDEGKILSGVRDPQAIAAVLGQHYAGVVLKLGAEGSLYAEDGRAPWRLLAEPAARVIDTTGAGDAFCAGFLAAWLADEPPPEALRWGSRLAARSIEIIGARHYKQEEEVLRGNPEPLDDSCS